MDEPNREPETEREAEAEAPAAETQTDEEPPGTPANPAGPQNAKEQFYEKIPMSYRQVDILVKVMIGVLAVALVVGILTGSRFS